MLRDRWWNNLSFTELKEPPHARTFCQRSTYQGRSICNTLVWWQCWCKSVNRKTLCAFIPLYWPTFAEVAIFSSASLLYPRTISYKSSQPRLVHLSFLLAQDRTNNFFHLVFIFIRRKKWYHIDNSFLQSLFYRLIIFR